MVLVLDSHTLPPADRADAIRRVFNSTEVPFLLSFPGQDFPVEHAIYHRQFRHGVGLLQSHGSSYRMRRGPKQLRIAAPERLALGLQLRGIALNEHNGQQTIVQTNDLLLVDETQTQDCIWPDFGACKAIDIDYSQIALTPDDVRAAIPRLASSPLVALVRSHLANLDANDATSCAQTEDMVGIATIELVRALILSATNEDPRTPSALHDALYLRVVHYIEENLGDDTLSVERIARTHNISLRQLYNIWAAKNTVPIAESIIRMRLEHARVELSRTNTHHMTIATIARNAGFADPTHFTRRFNAAFGCTPRDWRESRNAEGMTSH